jgi:hypothetical protein
MSFLSESGANALEYLIRIYLSDQIFDTSLKLYGVWPHQNEIKIVTKQRWIKGKASRRKDIIDLMNLRGFREVIVNGRTIFVRSADGLVVADLHEANVITTEKGLIPIDVIIGKPGDALAHELGLPS